MLQVMKLCECGCGLPAPIAKMTDAKRGYVKGQPRRFIHGHYARGRKHTPETIEKMRNAQRAEKHPLWKGEAAGYSAIHVWVRNNYVKQGRCETCGKEGRTEWANVSGEYKRVREDWIELCRPCHVQRDGLAKNLGVYLRGGA